MCTDIFKSPHINRAKCRLFSRAWSKHSFSGRPSKTVWLSLRLYFRADSEEWARSVSGWWWARSTEDYAFPSSFVRPRGFQLREVWARGRSCSDFCSEEVREEIKYISWYFNSSVSSKIQFIVLYWINYGHIAKKVKKHRRINKNRLTSLQNSFLFVWKIYFEIKRLTFEIETFRQLIRPLQLLKPAYQKRKKYVIFHSRPSGSLGSFNRSRLEQIKTWCSLEGISF